MNEKAIREAREQGALISSYNDISQLENVIRWKIADAQKMRGQQVDESTMQTMCKKIAKVLQRDYPNFTDAELDLVFDAGLAGNLGKEVWVSGASILQWLNHYQNNPVRIRIVESQNESKKNTVKLTKEQISIKNQKAFAEGYEKGKECYKKNGTIFHKDGFAIPQWPSLIYQEFRNRGLISKPTEEQKEYAEERAKEHETIHLTILGTDIAQDIIKEDIYKSYLLEAHYKEITSKSVSISDIINNNF